MRPFRFLQVLALLLAASVALFGTIGTAAAQQVDVYEQRVRNEVMRDTVQAGRFDDGRMWTFDHPPLDYFENTYGVRPDEQWLRRARLGALRIPGCTASFVSARGLIMTNHHCGRSHATAVGREGENILQDGFYAGTLSEERSTPTMYAEQLVRITDVTARVDSAVADAQTDAERQSARREAFEAISDELTADAGGEDAGFRTQVISLYDGAQFSAYTFRRYDDVRLVFIPELQVGYYGGDSDNFTYPRYVLDLALFRVYDGGEPLQPEVHFPWSTEGSRPGDPVFVVGNPGSTLRLETFSQLEFRRDVQDANLKAYLESRVAALQRYVDATPDASSAIENRIFSLRNGLKLYRGRLEALNDGYVMARIRDGEQAFVDAIQSDDSLRAQYGGLVDSMAALQEQKREVAPTYQVMRLATNAAYASATFRRALVARQYLERLDAGAGDDQLAELRQQILAGAQPKALDTEFLTERLRDVETYYGADSDVATAILDGRSPAEAARSIVGASVLSDTTAAARALDDGTLSMDDPAVQMVDAFWTRYQDYQSAWAGLNARQQEVAAALGRARFAAYGNDVPPDATFSLRLSDGVVKGYDYNGTVAPAFTTFFGMYEHYTVHGEGTEWDLPDRWVNPPASFDRSTPFNMVSTNDITGGNSGSPVLNAQLEVVGLAFDGNIESLAGDYIFLPGRMRTVSVDVRGMLEALDEIYGADRLVQEVTGGAFVESDAQAGASR